MASHGSLDGWKLQLLTCIINILLVFHAVIGKIEQELFVDSMAVGCNWYDSLEEVQGPGMHNSISNSHALSLR